MKDISISSKNSLQMGFDKMIDFVLSCDSVTIENYVDKLRSQNPGISDDRLAKKILHRKAMKNGFVGGALGLGGLPTLPVTVPADLASSWRIQASMAFSIAYVYGHTADTTDLRTDLYLILAGNSAKQCLKNVGIEVTKGVTKKAVSKHITREMMKKIWKIVPQKIITKAGQKSMFSFMKMVPIVGAPVGFIFDWFSAQIVGRAAIHYYKG